MFVAKFESIINFLIEIKKVLLLIVLITIMLVLLLIINFKCIWHVCDCECYSDTFIVLCFELIIVNFFVCLDDWTLKIKFNKWWWRTKCANGRKSKGKGKGKAEKFANEESVSNIELLHFTWG